MTLNEAISKIKPVNRKYLITYRVIFFAVILAALIVLALYAKNEISRAKASIITVTMPEFSAEELLTNPQARAQYLMLSVRGTKFFVYTVKPRENLWTIAKKHNLPSVHTVIGCNPQLKTYDVYVNQKIVIPSSGGSLHPVQPNDTWQTISERYDIDQKLLTDTNFGITDLAQAYYVFVPGKRPAVDLMNEEMQNRYALRDLFTSPLGGRLSSAFGKRKHPVTGKVSTHGGIDIAVPHGTWVGAAADGVVILASTNAGHYGTAVFIDHQNGYITHYGHLSSFKVRVGQKVKAHQLIGRAGSTGRSTGPHLHFTIKKNGVNTDPLKFLW